MADLSFDELKKILNPIGVKKINHTIFHGVSIDSRKIKKGDIFVALKGDRYDACDFLPEVFEKGAHLAVVNRDVDYPSIVVENTYGALKKIAGYSFKKSRTQSIAVLGSSGKTTTKDLMCSILKNKNCSKTFGNENNFIGVSKTLLNSLDSSVCVVEVGTNHKGEIADIASFFKPDIAVFTNIGKSHIGNFGSLDAILNEKVSIVADTTKIIYNYDDLYLRSALKDKDAVTCSMINPTADVYIHKFSDIGLTISAFGELIELGKFDESINIYNILLSVAASKFYDKDINNDEISSGISDFETPNLRMQKEYLEDTLFILDCYNANPNSMRFALSYLNQKSGKKLAVLGDMLELGDFSKEIHKEIGEYVNELDIDLVAYGKDALYIYERTKSKKDSVYFFSDKDEVVELLREIYKHYDTVLIKGSRGMKMEEIFYKLSGGG